MTEINNKDMLEISGGGISWGLIASIASGLIFIVGVFDGFINPKKCNN